mmetsp:Transcript_20214/g.60083  ORF Transcript_20214/g.60083 Transcript_20214/m.60083 type:complete len:236 (+) Transcript_20214:1034-1741(+)
MMCACALASRTRLTSSFTLRTAAFLGTFFRSVRRPRISASSSSRDHWPHCSGWSQNEPMYTRTHSGVLMTLPSDHMSAPYTRSSACASTRSALFSTTRILSSWPLSDSMALRNSSEMSSLCASKSSKITSARAANHSMTVVKSYERPIRCFSPERMPGVSMRVTCCSSGESSCAPWNLERKPLPNISRPRKGMLGDTASALPGVCLSSLPCITAMNRSVVGSGPMCCPGKSRPSR